MSFRPAIFKSHLSILFFALFINASLSIGNYAFPADAAIYSIHLLTMKTADEAKSKVKEFKDRGYNAFFRQEKSGDKETVFGVYIERFKTRPEAEKEAKILKDLDLITDFDVREISEKGRTDVAVEKVQESEKLKNKRTVKSEKPIEGSAPEKSEPAEKNAQGASREIKGFYLKVSSLKEETNAEETVKTLQDAGYHAFYNYENIKGLGDWYRVYLDGYQTKEEAEKDAKKLMESGIISGYEIRRASGVIPSVDVKQKNTGKVYCLHVASYKDAAHADEDVRRLTESGFKSFTRTVEVSGEQWFRVYIGEFSSENEAREKGAELVKKGAISYFKPEIMDKASQ